MRSFFFSILLIVLIYSGGYSQNKGLQKGEVPPELTYRSLAKNKIVSFKGDDFKDTVFLIDFWATWCAPCVESIPHLDSLIEKYKDKNVKFISITYEPRKLVEKFLIDHPLKSEVGLDDDFKIFRKYNAWAIPNIVMINSHGEIAGRIHPAHLTAEVINVLLKGGTPDLENTPENLFDPAKAEEYFRSYLKKK
jgi:thiol-disulfide isomerase/thioredoxin